MRYNDYFNEGKLGDVAGIVRAAAPAVTGVANAAANSSAVRNASRYGTDSGSRVMITQSNNKLAANQAKQDSKARIAEAKYNSKTAIKQAKINAKNTKSFGIQTNSGKGFTISNKTRSFAETMFLEGYYDALYDIDNS